MKNDIADILFKYTTGEATLEETNDALKEAEAKGSGVVSLTGKMIDKPVVLRAERALELARAVHIVVD